MRSSTIAILLASAGWAYAPAPSFAPAANGPGSRAQRTDGQMEDKLVTDLIDEFFDRARGTRLGPDELDDTTVGKSGTLAARPSSLIAVPSRIRNVPSNLRMQGSSKVAKSLVDSSSKRRGPLARTAVLTAPHNEPPAPLPMVSGLNGKAMLVEKSDIPTKGEVRRAMPPHVLKRDTKKSLMYAAASVVQSAACLAVGTMIPLKAAALPLWLAYAVVSGTVWTGMWVVAHECGHGAFSDNRALQDSVGYILHTALMVPYFSWQHSHAVHHANTNHITKGETHVPPVIGGRKGVELEGGEKANAVKKALGKHLYPVVHLVGNLVFGWPVYLMFGASGGPAYGTSNHFIPAKPFDTELWPGKWPEKVYQSDIGIVAMLGLLGALSFKFGFASVAALYLAPLIITNCWLVGYTWLQHTDVDVPHLSGDQHDFMRGAFLTIDRPYGRILDYLHHSIGSTHVAHHIDCTIPHYHAREATDAIAKNFPKAYLYDPTPIHKALWRVGANCAAVEPPKGDDGRYTWSVGKEPALVGA